jgi:N-acetylmuramic acid 6-phosphate (MurNAc-6-P) etherase
VILVLGPAAALRAIAAGIEEEGVPFDAAERTGDAAALGREAALAAPAGIGVGADAHRVVVCLAAHGRAPYVELAADRGRLAGHVAGRLTSRRPLPSLEA